ncbi:DNA polymerase III subunit gamma/tau [Flavobacterium sp.]|uniref:DNA polymerase III subunit gamma/tau n=1 Tax=Flavobacterium sp. TaxID=239 RepID=UPI0025BA8C01|nr:DNA polymerase III subunit gamma/tau [Flavobacterium sp.]
MEISVSAPEIVTPPEPKAEPEKQIVVRETVATTIETRVSVDQDNQIHSVEKTSVAQNIAPVSALSLSSIRAKKVLEQNRKANTSETVHLPTEAFTENDMLLQWNKFAQRLSDKGQKIMESLLLINDPKLEGTTIIHELPNEGSKIDFESGKHDLVGYLRGKLHNHDIEIKIIVNESMESKKAFTPQDRYNRLNQINPNLDTLRRTFDLDF